MIAYLRPGGVGNYDEWALSAGSTKTSAVDGLNANPATAPTHDNATSYIGAVASSGIPKRQSFTVLGGAALPVVQAVNSVKPLIRVNGGSVTGTSYQALIRVGGSDGLSGSNFVPEDTGWYTYGEVLSRPGGGLWASTDINTALEFGVRITDIGEPTGGSDTTCWIELDYEQPAGGFAFLLASILTPLVGGLLLGEMPRLSVEAARRSPAGATITAAEYEPAWREWREARWPVRFFRPGAGLLR